MARDLIALRLTADAVAVIDAWAAREQTTRSEMIRTLLREALTARQTGQPPSPQLVQR